MANDFSSRFLKLREERLERQSSGQAASGSGTTRTASPSPAPARKVTATAQQSGTEDSFSSRFLKLREERLNRQAEGQARPSAASASPTTPIRSAASMLSRMERPASFGLSEQRAATQTPAAGQTGGQGGRTTRRAQLESDLAKVNHEQRLLAARTNLARRSRGFTTEDREAAETEAAPLRREAEDLRHGMEGIDYQDKYDAITRKDNFGGQFLSSYDVGRMGQDEAMAWYEYLSNPTEGNRAYAESVSAALQDYILRNQAALDEDATLPIISQSLARYLPQFINQQKYGIGGALVGAAAGSVLPVAGTAAGAKIGYTGGRALYGYETARGAAFKALLDAGVDEETARAASNDEAIINSVIEGGDAVLDMLTLGIGRGISAILGQPVEAAATTAGRKALAALGKYGINVASEGAQEWVQEGVSTANEGRTDTGLLNLISESAGQIGRAVSGQDPEALARMNEAGLEGLRVAAIMGAAGMAGNAAVNRVLRRPATQQQSQEDGLSQEAEAQAQTDSGIPEATRRAVEMLAQGEEISGNQAARIAENEEAMALLSQLTGEEIDTDAPISRVKSDIRALASRQERLSGETGANSQAAGFGAQTQERPAAMRAYDVRRMEQAADTLGESGSRALKAAYDGSMDADRFYAGFSTYYEAGLSGRDMGRVRSEYAQDLTEAQRYAAYTAGQNDAEASLRREREGVQFATVYGDDAGFIPSDYSGDLPQDTVRFYNALGRATGTKITIAAATGEGGANGWYSNGTVYIAADAENAGSVVAKHEITHRLQEIAPEAYRTYRDYAVNAMAEQEGSTATLVERYKARYAQSGVNLTTEQAMDEIAADFTEALTVDPSQFDTLAQEHRSVARRVLDALRDFISKVKALFKGRSDQDRAAMSEYGVSMETLERAARLWEETLRAGQAQVSTMTEAQQRVEFSDVNTRYSLREKEPPKKTGVAYKVFFAKNGELYPPMVANPGGEGTPVGVWLDADVGQAAPPSKTGRAQVQAGGRGTNAAKGSLAFRPGWHLGDIPLAKQFARKNPATGVKDLFPADFVWAECEYAMDVDYQEEAMSYGYTENGKFRHSYAGLPKLPTDGYYRYRTNPNPDTVPWIITGAMRVRRILTDAETDAICREAGVEPMQRQGGPLDEAGLERLGLEAGDVTGNTRFSMKSAVEDNGTLLALHNLTEDKLRSALRLGGFPMPSIAVTRADIPHTNFGDITLVMSRQTVDPRANRRNTVYSADAWTPTFPAIEYEADPQTERRISRRIGELSAQVDPFFQDDLRRVQYGLDDYLNRHGGEEGLARWAMDNYGLKAAYLEEQGKHIAAVTTQREADRGYNMDRAEQYQAVADVLGTTDPEAIGSMNLKELRDQHGEALERAYPGMTKSALRMSGVLRQVQAYLEGRDSEPTYEAVTDSAATRRAVDNALDQAGYEQWVRELYSGIEAASGVYNNKERFTPSGNRRSFQQTHYPVTLDNITKAMAGQNNGDSRNVSGFYGIKSLRAGMAERFKSIADMHRLEGRLQNLTQEEADAISNALDSRLSAIMEELAEKYPSGGRRYDYMQMDAIGNILMEIADGGTYTIDSIMRRLNEEYHYHVSNELAAKIRDLLFDVSQMPVNLFEAKPERSVHFNEVLAAVLPDNVGSGLSDDLLAAGVGQVLTYEEGNDTDRLAEVNSVEGARFSLKPTDSRGRELSEEQRRYFQGSKITDADGRLLVLYHGTTAYGEITRFRRGRSGWLGPGIYLASRQADAKRYADAMGDGNGQLYELYANVTNPLVVTEGNPVPEILRAAYGRDSVYRSRSAKQGNDAQIITTADIKKLQSKGYDGIRWDFGGSTEVSVFSPEQIKRVDNLTPSGSQDVRRSIKGGDILRQNAALQEENELLRERVEYWRGQTRRTERVSIDKKAVTRAAREMIRAYDSGLDAAELAGDLQGLYSFVMNDGDERGAFSDTELRRRANEIARKLVDSASVLEDESYRDYADLRAYLRDTPLSISAEDRGDIADFGDFRRRNFGRMTIRSGPTNIDQVYQELAAAWPEFFDEMRESTPSDQLVHIAEVLDGIYQVTERNPFAGYFDAAVTDAANEIMERFFDLPQTRPTFADRQARKLDSAKAAGRRRLEEQRERSDARLAELREQNRERVQRAIQRERETRARQIDRLKTRYAARDAAGRERRSARELRARISRHVADLNRRLLRPSDKRHIPEGLRKSVAAVLDAINMESAYTVDPTTGSVRKSGGGSPTRRTEAFQALRQEYQKILSREDSDMVVDPSLFGDSAADIVGNFDKIQAMRDVRLADMNTEQLTTIWNTIRAVERSITTAGKVLSGAKYAATSEWAGALERDTATRRPIRTLTDNGVLKSLMNPYTFFSQYGEAGLAIYRMLRNAQDQQEVMTDQVREAARKVVDPKTVKRLEETVGTFTTERGERLSLSKAQVMEVYLLMKRKQAQKHLLEGGIFQPAIKSAKIRRGEDAIRLTEKDLADIIGSLSDEEARIADGLQALTGGMLAEMGNRASMLAYGYQKFTEDHYWPIHSAKEGLYSEAERSPNNVRSIKNIGMAQSVTPHANNALDIPGLFDTFASHAGDMVDYSAWLAPMEDANRLFNFRYQADENAPTRKTVKGLLDRVGGAGSQAYWRNLMDDIQNGISAPGDDALTSRVSRGIGSFKSAAVGGNLRVVIQQPTAYLRAGTTLSPTDLSKGLARGATRGNGWKKALKYSPIAMRKADGGFDISSPMRMKEQMFDGRSRVQKLNELASTPAAMADAITWGRLWNACEWAVSRENKELTKGSEAFYQKVNELFTEVIDQTQVVDGVLQRSNIMRSRSEIAKQATSFMGEPIMALNLMIRAYDQVRYEQDPKKRGKAIKAFGRTVSALVLTNLVNAAAQSLVDALRDADADKEYWERFLAAFTGITGEEDSAWDKAWAAVLGGNAGSGLNPLGQIPFVKDVFSLVQGYDVSRTDMEVFSDLVRAAQTMLQSADGGGSKTRAYAAREVAAAGAKVFGIPVGNLTRDAWALLRSVAIESGNIPLQYEMEKAIYNISSDKNYTRYIDILYRAKNSGDQAVYESIYADMVANGIPEKSIKSGMEQRMKKDQGVESVEDLSSRYLTPSQEQTYDRLYGQVSKSSVWRSASQAQRKAMEEDLYDLTTGTDAGASLREKIDGGSAYGVTDADYLLYLTAREIVDSRNEDPEKRNGSIDQAEAQEAIDMLSGLSDEARAYLWQSTNKGWSEEKNPYR